MASAKVAQAYRDNDYDESEEDDFSDEEEDSPQSESRTHNCQRHSLRNDTRMPAPGAGAAAANANGSASQLRSAFCP